MPRTILFALIAVLMLPASATAHYPWLLLKPRPGEHGTVEFHFQEGPRPGPGKYLDPFVQRGQCWFRKADGKPMPFALDETREDGFRWLQAKLPAAAPRSVDLYTKWGVYRYGKTDVLLHYHARTIDVSSAEELQAISRSPKLDVDLAPQWKEGKLVVTLLRKGQPVEGRPVRAFGPQRFKANPKTDAAGQFTIAPTAPGRYLIRTWVREKAAGEFEGKAYEEVRRHVTLVMELPIAAE